MEERRKKPKQTDGCLLLHYGQGITDYFKEDSKNVPLYRAVFRGETVGTNDKAYKPTVKFCVTLQESRTVQLLPSTAVLFIS